MTAPTPDLTGLADRIEGLIAGGLSYQAELADTLWVNRHELVAALRHAADLEREADELRGRVAFLEEENDELHEDFVRVMHEHDTVDRLARDMATAIGWETEGENWVEKARTASARLAAADQPGAG